MTSDKTPADTRPSFAPNVSLHSIEQIELPHPDTWGPPPLHPFLFQERQAQLLRDVEALTAENIPEGTPPDVATHLIHTGGSRFVGRMQANYDNLASANRLNAPLTPRQRRMGNLALAGLANPAEIIYFSDLIQMRGAALGAVTHPGGAVLGQDRPSEGGTIEPLETMRAVVDDTLTLFGAEKFGQAAIYSIKNAYGVEWPEGLAHSVLMTRKRTLGRVDRHIWVAERSSFLLRLDEAAALSPSMRADVHKRVAAWTPKSLVTSSGEPLHEAVDTLLRSNDFATAIPLATTIYKYDENIPKVVREGGNQWHADWRKASPNLAMQLTAIQLKEAGVPNSWERARRLPLSRLVVPPVPFDPEADD